MPLNLIVFLVIATTVRLVLALLFPLTADESYYWLWSKHLALGYVDHPPMVAYINYLCTFGQPNLIGLRLAATALTLLISLNLYFLVRRLLNEQVAFWSVVLFQILPHFAIIWLTMFVELPYAFFWSLSLLIMAQILKSGQKNWWYLLGVTIGLGCLSKYTMLFFWGCLLIFFFLSPAQRHWLKKKESYLAMLISLLVFSPVLFWNSQQQWASFSFHSTKVLTDIWGANILPFFADQLVHFTPFVIVTILLVRRFALTTSDETRMLFSFSVPVLFTFFLLSAKVKVWSHWPSVGYIAMLPLIVDYLIVKGKSLKLFVTWIVLFSLAILSILLWVTPGILLHQPDYKQNYRLSSQLTKEFKIFAGTNVAASLVEFYSHQPTYLVTGFLKPHPLWGEKQYELWGVPDLTKGETVIYFGADTPWLRETAAQYFRQVTILPEIKLNLIEDYITSNYRFFKLEGYQSHDGHP